MYKLIGVCGCCANAHVIDESYGEIELEAKMKQMIEDINEFCEKDTTKYIFKQLDVQDHREVSVAAKYEAEKLFNDGKEEQADMLYTLVGSLIQSAPDGFCLNLQIV